MDENAARSALETALKDYRQDFETFFLARLFSLSFAYEDETCTVSLPVSDFMYNPQGSLHGGVIAFAMDVASGHLLKHTFGASGATLEMKLQFLAPVRGPAARCTAKFLRKGRSICFIEARLFDGGCEPAVVATSTWRINKPRATGEAEAGTAAG